MFSKHIGNQEPIPQPIQKQGSCFENTLWGLTHSYNNRVFLGFSFQAQTKYISNTYILIGSLQIANH